MSARFRVRIFGPTLGSPPIADLEYMVGIPIRWTANGTIPVHLIAIDPVEVASPSIVVCEAPAMSGSPLCDLPKGHEGMHAYSEIEEGKKRTYKWGKNLSDKEARLKRALEVLRYVAEVYRSPAVQEALKELEGD